jgi:hypothetical protein
MAEHRIKLNYGDEVTLVLADGQEVSVLYDKPDDDQPLPELDIMLPRKMAVNCFKKGLVPAVPGTDDANVIEAKQLIIPVELRG